MHPKAWILADSLFFLQSQEIFEHSKEIGHLLSSILYGAPRDSILGNVPSFVEFLHELFLIQASSFPEIVRA